MQAFVHHREHRQSWCARRAWSKEASKVREVTSQRRHRSNDFNLIPSDYRLRKQHDL
jgi:hypothetical protein